MDIDCAIVRVEAGSEASGKAGPPMARTLKTWRNGRLYESPEAAALAGAAVTLFGLLPAPVVEEPETSEVLGAEYEAWLDALAAKAGPRVAGRARALRAAAAARKLAEAA
jgi:hypothetical protein